MDACHNSISGRDVGLAAVPRSFHPPDAEGVAKALVG